MNYTALCGVFLSVAFLCAVGSLSASPQFSGIIETLNMTTDETGAPQTYTMTMWVKNNKVRVHTTAIGGTAPMTLIYRNDLGVVWVLDDEEKLYYEIEQGEQEKAPVQPGQGYRVRRTGKTRTLLGFKCQQIMIEREGESTEIWGTKDLTGLLRDIQKAMGQEQSDGMGGWTDEVLRLGIYPLSAKTKLEGRLVESQEVRSIKRMKLADDLFEIPKGYKKQDVQSLIQR